VAVDGLSVKEEKRMRRILSIAMTLMLVFSFAAGMQSRPASAQPTARGEAVSITDAAGEPWVEVSVDAFAPDFTGYDRSYAPERGFQFAAVTVTITNIGTSSYAPNSYNFALIDTEGFVNDSTWVVVDETQAPAVLGSDMIEPGASASGLVVFQMLAGTEAAGITFAVTYDRFAFLALNGAPPALGDTVEVLGPDAQPLLNISVDEWLDPLPGVDSSSPPDRGHHFGGAVVTMENVSGAPFQTDPWQFKMLDSDGYEAGGSMPYRPEQEVPDLQYTELADGDTLTGVVGFQVFNTASPGFIAFDTGDQFTLVAAFPDAPAIPQLSGLPEVEAPAPSTGGGDTTDDQATVQVSEECQAADAWVTDFFARLDERVISDFDFADAVDMSADELVDVQRSFEDLIDEMDAEEPPALVQEVFDTFVQLLEYAVDSLDGLIEAAENGDDLQPLVDAILADEAAFENYFAAIDEYTTACPTE
jgi:hypothetical protein